MTSKTATAGPATDRQAVLDVLARLYRAWEAGDAETFVADYTEDASVIQPGVYEKDREEIRTYIAAAFAGPLNGSRVAARPVNVRVLTGDTAIVVSEDGIIFPGQDAVASPPTTTAPPAKAPSSGYGSKRVPGPWQRLSQSWSPE